MQLNDKETHIQRDFKSINPFIFIVVPDSYKFPKQIALQVWFSRNGHKSCSVVQCMYIRKDVKGFKTKQKYQIMLNSKSVIPWLSLNA